MTRADKWIFNGIHVKAVHLVRASFSSPFKSLASKSNTREKLPFEALWTSNTCKESNILTFKECLMHVLPPIFLNNITVGWHSQNNESATEKLIKLEIK